MSLEFEQRRKKHAIGQFNAVVTFFRPLSSNGFASAAKALSEYASENNLPALLNQQVLTFEIGLGGQPTSFQQPQTAGWQRFAADGEVEQTISCDQNSVTFSTRNYPTWVELKPGLVDFFSRMSHVFFTEVPAISTFQITYINEFRRLSASSDGSNGLFRNGSQWIVPNHERFTDSWHSHAGGFEDISDNHRRLVNVNVDYTKQITDVAQFQSFLSAIIVVSENYDLPNQPPLIVPVDHLETEIERNLENAHRREKEVLAELFSDQYLNLMGA